MDMLRCYNSLCLRRKYEDEYLKNSSRVHYNLDLEFLNTVIGTLNLNNNMKMGFEFSSLPPVSMVSSDNGISDKIMEKYNDVKYVLDTYSDYDNNKIIFSSIYMTSSCVADNNRLKPEMLSCYRFELERIEEYIKKCNNKYKYDDEYKKYIKYNSIANKYPAFPKIFSMQFHKNGKEVIEDN